MTVICPNCHIATQAEYNFCTHCDRQITCLSPNCSKPLLPGKSFCFYCGVTVQSVDALDDAPTNHYSRSFKQTGRSVEEQIDLRLTDHAVSQLAPFVAGQILRPTINIAEPQKRLDGALPALSKSSAPAAPSPLEDVVETIDAPTSGAIAAQRSGITSYFIADGDILIAREKDFRGKSWAEQQRRFLLLYISAYVQILGKHVPSREHLRAAADRAHIVDTSNFKKYITSIMKEHASEVSDGIILNNRGEREAEQILGEMAAAGGESGYEYWDRPPTTTSKRYRITSHDKDEIGNWVSEVLDLDQLDFRSLKSAAEYALFSVWAITTKLKKLNAVRWNLAYEFICRKFETVSAKPEAFRRAFDRPVIAPFVRSGGEQYYLTPKGEELVESWISTGIVSIPDEHVG